MTRTVTELANNFYDEYNSKYAKVLNKYGCNTSELAQLQYDIENGKKELVCTIKYYKRLPSGRFSTKYHIDFNLSIEIFLIALSFLSDCDI